MSEAVSTVLTICNAKGLHARASAKFVKTAAAFDAAVRVAREGTEVDAASIMGLLMLGAGLGSTIEVSAEGSDAEEALAALTDLVERRFDEDS